LKLSLNKIHPSKNDLNREKINSDIRQKNIAKESFDDLFEIRQEEEDETNIF
jgi:hypothetical protein